MNLKMPSLANPTILAPMLAPAGWAALVVLGLALVARIYWPGISGPLLLDDFLHIPPFTAPGADAADPSTLLFNSSGPLKRPVAMASFLFNAYTSADDYSLWKRTNVLIHLLNGVVVFWLASLLFGAARSPAACRGPDWTWGGWCAALWAAHPLHVSTVLYTVQRMTELSALFSFIALGCYAVGRIRQIQNQPGWAYVALALLAFTPLAALSKENGVLTPALACLVELFIFRFQGPSPATRPLKYGYLAILLAGPLLWLAIKGADLVNGLLGGYEFRPFSLHERLLTEFRVLGLYLQQLLLPTLNSMAFYYDDFPVSKSLLDPPSTLLWIGLILLLILSAVWLRAKLPLYGLGILFFFAGHLVESTIFPLELAFEHRNYLPSLGLIIASVGAVQGIPTDARKIKIAWGALAILLALYASLTALRVQTWQSDLLISAHALNSRPNSNTAAAQIAEALTGMGRYDEALAILAGHPGSGPALQGLYIRCRGGVANNADVERITNTLDSFLDVHALSGIIEVSGLVLDHNCAIAPEAMLALIAEAKTRRLWNPALNQYKLGLYQAHLLWEAGRRKEAIEALARAHEFQAHDPVALFLGTEWLLDMGEGRRAEDMFGQALILARQSPQNYGELLERIGKRLEKIKTQPLKID